MRRTQLNKFKSRNNVLIILLKVVLVWYVVIFSTSYLTTNTTAYFTTHNETEDVIKIGDWEEPDDSVLATIKKGNQSIKACDQSIDLKVKLTNNGTAMKSDSTYEIYFAESGNPEKQGTKLKLGKEKGTISALQGGETIELIHKTKKPGTYVFLVNQSNDDLKEQKTWSEWIKLQCPSDGKPKTKEKADKAKSKNVDEPNAAVKETNKKDSTSKETKQESKEQKAKTKEADKDTEKDSKKEKQEQEKNDNKDQDTEKEKSTTENNKVKKTEMKAKTKGESKTDAKTKSGDNNQANDEQEGEEE